MARKDHRAAVRRLEGDLAMSEVTIQLTNRHAHGKEVHELSLREPTARCDGSGLSLGMGVSWHPSSPRRSAGLLVVCRRPANVPSSNSPCRTTTPHWACWFFRRLGRSGSGLSDLAFELAFFWMVSAERTLPCRSHRLLAWDQAAQRSTMNRSMAANHLPQGSDIGDRQSSPC
jgi:hypothetical protein